LLELIAGLSMAEGSMGKRQEVARGSSGKATELERVNGLTIMI
jgi:hypothetical protein